GGDPPAGARGRASRERARLGRSARAGGVALDRARREDRRAQPRSRHADGSRRELHRQHRERRAPVSKVDAYAQAVREVARAEGVLGGVEDDLFRFARAFEANDNLRVALTDPHLPVDRRLAVIDELMAGKALPVSAALASMIVAAGQAADLPAIVDRFVEL